MEEHQRPAKRARQACEPCRRKKSKCPGEKPACSHCRRLGQSCVYATDESERMESSHTKSNQILESRMETLESKLDALIEHITPASKATTTPDLWHKTPTRHSPHRGSSAQPQNASGPLAEDGMPMSPEDTEMAQVGHLYVAWCHNQPLAMFNKATFPESLGSRDRELQLAVKSLALRFQTDSTTPKKRRSLESMAKESRRLAMGRVIEGEVNLSTLHTLCILSVIDFAHGKSIQAGLNLSIADGLAHRVNPGNYLGDFEEFNECIRAIRLLRRLQAPILPLGRSLLTSSQAGDLCSATEPPISFSLSLDEKACAEIAWYSSRIGEAWYMAREYAAARIEGSQGLPPWDPQSDYSSVLQRHMVFDSTIPMKHRYSFNKFEDRTLDELQARRDYWGPWLFMQIMYATIPCILNHPFLLSMRLRHFRYTIPQMFIHQSFEQITRCSGWIIFFLDLVEKKGFELSDPTLAHCVVVVATIHLQHSFVVDASLRKKAQGGFEKCMRFLRRMGAIWPSVSVMADNLKQLQDSIIGVPATSSTNAGDANSPQAWSINAQLLWDLLIYEKAGRENAAVDQTMYGSSFKSATETHGEEVADFDLVGSAGILAHRLAPKEIEYAPESEAKTPRPGGEFIGNMQMGGSVEDRIFEGLTGFNEQDSLFLQANDFGRAIDNWLDFDML